MHNKLIKITIAGISCLLVLGGGALLFQKKRIEKKEKVMQEIRQSGALQKFFSNKTLEVQSLADDNYMKLTKEVEASYPWIEKLPLHDTTYFIYFNTRQKQFIGIIFDTSTPELSKQAGLAALKSAGAPVGAYPIVWSVR